LLAAFLSDTVVIIASILPVALVVVPLSIAIALGVHIGSTDLGEAVLSAGTPLTVIKIATSEDIAGLVEGGCDYWAFANTIGIATGGSRAKQSFLAVGLLSTVLSFLEGVPGLAVSRSTSSRVGHARALTSTSILCAVIVVARSTLLDVLLAGSSISTIRLGVVALVG